MKLLHTKCYITGKPIVQRVCDEYILTVRDKFVGARLEPEPVAVTGQLNPAPITGEPQQLELIEGKKEPQQIALPGLR
jgi:hypothetical protein